MTNQYLTLASRTTVEEMRKRCRDKDGYMKLSVLVLLDEGKGYEEISVLLGISQGTVRNCKHKYESDGLTKYLDRHYIPYSGKMSKEEMATVDAEVSSGLYTTSLQVADYIEQTFGHKYSESAVRAILHKLDFVHKKTSEVPSKFDEAEQDAFLEQLKPFLNEIGKNEAVFFTDAMHPQHNTRSSYAWIKKGQEKVIPTNTGRRRINVNGAMNAHNPEETIIVEADTINAQATIELYQKVQQMNLDKHTIFMICDNARYYYNTELKAWLDKNPRIVQIFLPPYSPNLNLIERLWKFLRKKVINTVYYPDFKDFRRAVLGFFENIEQYKTELKSLISFNFQRLSKPVVAQ
jgi:transposase